VDREIPVARLDVLEKFLHVSVLHYAFVPYAPTYEVELALEFSEKFACSFITNLLVCLSPVLEYVLIKTSTSLDHVEVFEEVFLILKSIIALGYHQEDICISEDRIVV
jgi:hypothetical protein